MKRNVDFYVKKRNELIDLLDEEKNNKARIYFKEQRID